MLGKKNGINIKAFQPIANRPKLIVGELEDGRQAIFGDSCPLNTAEFMLLHGGYAEPTTPRLQFTDSEQTEIDAAEDCLTRTSTLVDTLYEDGRKLSEDLRAAHPPPAFGDTPLSEERAEIVQNIEAQVDELRGRIERSNKLEHRALIERNTIQQRITAAARERQFPIQVHNPPKSLDEALTTLEGDQ